MLQADGESENCQFWWMAIWLYVCMFSSAANFISKKIITAQYNFLDPTIWAELLAPSYVDAPYLFLCFFSSQSCVKRATQGLLFMLDPWNFWLTMHGCMCDFLFNYSKYFLINLRVMCCCLPRYFNLISMNYSLVASFSSWAQKGKLFTLLSFP